MCPVAQVNWNVSPFDRPVSWQQQRETKNRDISLKEFSLTARRADMLWSSLVVSKLMFTSAFHCHTKTTNWCSESGDRFYGIMDKIHLKISHFFFFKGIVQLKINSGCVSSLTQTLDKCVWVLTPLFEAHMHAAELVLPSPSFVPFVMTETQSWTLTAPLFKVWHDLIPFIKRGSWFHTQIHSTKFTTIPQMFFLWLCYI